jgi:hypothetical protein
VRGFREIPSYQALGAERDPQRYRERYDAEVRYFDHELGRLLAYLEHEGLLDQAVVVFTADHGESLGEHDWWFTHGWTLYRELVRVPLLLRLPAGLAPPPAAVVDGLARSDALVGHVDVFATLLAALGLDPGATRGRSLLAGAVPAPRVLTAGAARGQRALVRADGRALAPRAQPARDAPLRSRARSARGARPRARAPRGRAELEARASQAERAVSLPRLAGRSKELSEEELETMRKLGYAGAEDDK